MKKLIGMFIFLSLAFCNISANDPIIFINNNGGFEKEVGVYQSPTWMVMYGTDMMLNGQLMEPGDTIFIYCKCTSEGCDEDKLVGAGRVITCPDNLPDSVTCVRNRMLFTAIYHDDVYIDSLPNCPVSGDSLFIRISSEHLLPYTRVFVVESSPTLTWTNFGDFIPMYYFNTSCCKLRGDLDRNHILDISDLMYMIDYQLLNGIPPKCMDEADVTGDGSIDVSDLIMMIDYMFLNGPPFEKCFE